MSRMRDAMVPTEPTLRCAGATVRSRSQPLERDLTALGGIPWWCQAFPFPWAAGAACATRDRFKERERGATTKPRSSRVCDLKRRAESRDISHTCARCGVAELVGHDAAFSEAARKSFERLSRRGKDAEAQQRRLPMRWPTIPEERNRALEGWGESIEICLALGNAVRIRDLTVGSRCHDYREPQTRGPVYVRRIARLPPMLAVWQRWMWCWPTNSRRELPAQMALDGAQAALRGGT